MRGLALFDCQADDPSTELSFKKGELFSQLKPSPEKGWFLARKQGASEFKLVPENYIKIIIEAPPPVQPKPKLNLSEPTKLIDSSPRASLEEIELDDKPVLSVKDRRALFESQKLDLAKVKKTVELPQVKPIIPKKSIKIPSPEEKYPKNFIIDPFSDSYTEKSFSTKNSSLDSVLYQKETLESFSRKQADSSPLNFYQQISSSDRQKYLALFSNLDKKENGILDGVTIRNVWLRSELDLDILAQIWDLLDPENEGTLSASSFAIGLHLIDKQLAGIPWNDV